jgi:hypothetical protein
MKECEVGRPFHLRGSAFICGWDCIRVDSRSPFGVCFVGLLQRWDEMHFLELSEEAEEHFFGVDPFQEAVTAGFGGVGHDVVFDVKDGFAEGPGDGLVEGVLE